MMFLLQCKESPWFLHAEDVYWTRYLKCCIVAHLCKINGYDIQTISYDDLYSNSIQQLNNKSFFKPLNSLHCTYNNVVMTLVIVLHAFSNNTSRINIFSSFIKKGYIPNAEFLVYVVECDNYWSLDLFTLLFKVNKQYFSSNVACWNQRAFGSSRNPTYAIHCKNYCAAEILHETFEEDTISLWNNCFAARHNLVFMKLLLSYPETSDSEVSSHNVAIICGLQNRCLLYALIHSKKKYAVDFSLLERYMERLPICECEWRVRFVLEHSQSKCIAKKWVAGSRWILRSVRVFYCSKQAFWTLFHLVRSYPRFARALIEDERHVQLCLTFFKEVGHTKFTYYFLQYILVNVSVVHMQRNMLALFDMYVKICSDGKLGNDLLQEALNLFAQAADTDSIHYTSHLQWKQELLWRYPYAHIVIPKLSTMHERSVQVREELIFFRRRYDFALKAKDVCYSNAFLPPVIFNLIFWFLIGSDVFQCERWLQLSTILL